MEENSYDAYGNLLDKTGSTINPYLYRGEQYDDELSSYYLRARYYQPGIGRFLTTDPVEGFPNNPMTLHRYVYGNDDPVNFLDPSGEMSTQEVIIVAGILNVAAIGIGTLTEAGQQAYADLGEYIFPDAFAVGIGIYGSMNIPFFLSGLFTGNLATLVTGPHVMLGGGGEVLFSVSSGEIGFYRTSFWNVALGFAEPFQVKLDLYKGLVWNLWNAKTYEGPFCGFSLSLGNTLGSAGGFWDAKHGFTRGAWGVGRTFLSLGWPKLLPPSWGQWTFAFNCVNYKMFKDRKTLHPAGVVAAIVTANIVCNFIETVLAPKIKGLKNFVNPYNIGVLAFETSIWVQTGMAKHYWGKKMPHYNYETRREEGRPSDFQSGPGLFRYGFL